MNSAISVEKQPWYTATLARMDHRAKCSCSAEGLRHLGEGLRSTQLTPEERFVICARLMTMVRDNGGNYANESVAYLEHLSHQLDPLRPWYMVALGQMSIYASSEGYMQELTEAGDDLKSSSITDDERDRIVAKLDNMLAANVSNFNPHGFAYLESLRKQLSEGM